MDRLVRQVYPELPEANSVPFASFAEARNIVVLGEPGAGKTSLFKWHSAQAGGRYLTVRSFLNFPLDILGEIELLFLDALDEKRAGRSDSSTVDVVVQKLLALRPARVRLSCRAADWLGETDLIALSDYFDIAGGASVVALEALTLQEQHTILQLNGVSDPGAFIDNAQSHGLGGLLGNPQNLLMLLEAVRDSGWPSSKRELLERACVVLLSENNAQHLESAVGQPLPAELLDAAGGIFAVRLIGDAAGISITASYNEDCPSYRELPVDELFRVQAALSRRVFVQTDISGIFDYAHRTIAEYLAARWLSRRVRSGLSIPRLLSLLGYAWKPASELRGLYAWLPVMMAEHARVFIENDPFAVLSYGDPASLSVSSRQLLLSSLGELAETDPWFRKSDWSKAVAWGLAGPDLYPIFKQILSDKSTSFALRSIILDSLSFCPLPAELRSTLASLINDPGTPYSEREDALELLQGADPSGAWEIFSSLGNSQDALRLKTGFLCAARQAVAPYEYAALINQLIRLPSRASAFGSYFRLAESVPDDLVPSVLHALRPPRRRGRGNSGSSVEGVSVVDRLISRAISAYESIEPSVVFRWLLMRHKLVGAHGGLATDSVRARLATASVLLEGIASELLLHVEGTHANDWGISLRMRSVTLDLIDDGRLTNEAITRLEKGLATDRRALYLFVVATVARMPGTLSAQNFERIAALGEIDVGLRPIWDEWRFQEIPEWRVREQARIASRRTKDQEARAKFDRDFDEAAEKIASGEHIGWLGWLGKVYCARFADMDGSSPLQRLIAALGPSRAAIALQGLQAFAKSKVPTLPEVIDLHRRGLCRNTWDAFMAGLDLIIETEAEYNETPVITIQAAFAIDIVRPTYNQSRQSAAIMRWTWRKLAEQRNAYALAQVLAKLAVVSIEGGQQHLDGLHELITNDSFSRMRYPMLRGLVREYPDCSLDLLRQALPSLLNDAIETCHGNLALEGYEACRAARLYDLAVWWFGFGLVCNADRFRQYWAENVNLPGVLWALRDLDLLKTFGGDAEHRRVRRLMDMAEFALRVYPNVNHPSGGWTGDKNAWDAAEFVRKILAEIAGSTGDFVEGWLRSQVHWAVSCGYGDYLKHLLAEHVRQRIDAGFRQPSWREARDALLNLLPCNAAQLNVLISEEIAYFGLQAIGSNTDNFKRFWNEDSYGRIVTPKSEESARDVLVEALRQRLAPLEITVEPEGHMVNDKRADIVAARGSIKSVIELKRDYHTEVWSAAWTQLDRFYTRDPGTNGFGVYGVFWYGNRRGRAIPTPPAGIAVPETAAQMEVALRSLVPEADRARIHVAVIDVSGE